MVAPPRCQDCRVAMDYAHESPRPDRTVAVFECPECGGLASGERGSPEVLDW